MYEGNSKIILRFVGKKKRVVIAPKPHLSSNKLRLTSLNTYLHTFSLRSVGVITIIAAPASFKVSAVIRFLHAEVESAAEIHCRLCLV
jgi:hypothetical protein